MSALDCFRRVIGEPICLKRMGANEREAMTPLFWDHVNPYGTFQLAMNRRLQAWRGVGFRARIAGSAAASSPR
jgi:hypothetical protein